MMTDPIADMLTRIRNANTARHEMVEIPGSKLKTSMAEIMKREGFIKDYQLINGQNRKVLRVYLKYARDSKRVLSGLKRISKPGLRVYANKDNLPRVLGGLGIAIVSTSQGLMTDKEARKAGTGGEVLCYIW